MSTDETTTSERDWVTTSGLVIVGIAAAVTSFTELIGLADHAGWKNHLSLLLPANVDVYGFTATRIWLSPSSGEEVKRHARIHAFAALMLSMTGNAINHALDAGALKLGSNLWILVVAVSLIPPSTLGALMHLITLRGRDRATEPKADERTEAVPNRATEPRTVPPARTAPVGSVQSNRATTVPQPSQSTAPTVPPAEPVQPATVPSAKPVTEPVKAGTDTDRAITESRSGTPVPPELRPGVKAPDFVLAAAREIYEDNPKLTDRKLAVATRDHFKVPYAVIGRSACQTIIAEADGAEATG